MKNWKWRTSIIWCRGEEIMMQLQSIWETADVPAKLIMSELSGCGQAIELLRRRMTEKLWADLHLLLYRQTRPLKTWKPMCGPHPAHHRIKEAGWRSLQPSETHWLKMLQDYNHRCNILCSNFLAFEAILMQSNDGCTCFFGDTAQAFGVVVFHCRHMFHKECLPSPGNVPGIQYCNICSAKRRGPGSGILEMKK
ncbi:hypothetical protein cypCar_00031432 [Cyprinus carpio]|nr:hypothetical protein cypCar_00031432 [Cyprinus carpio]